MSKPNSVFEYTRADEVAECWAGVSKDLYFALWAKVVSYQLSVPNLEDSGPHDHVGHESLAKHWHRLSSEEQDELNALAERDNHYD